MKTLIICSSPYTIFNGVNYVLSRNIKADIIISKLSPSVSEIGNKLRECQLFNSVSFINDIQESRYIKPLALLTYLFPTLMLWILGLRRIDFREYNVVISQNHFFISLVSRLIKGADYFLMEEGLGSYVNKKVIFSNRRNKYFTFVDKYIFHGALTPEIKGLFLYKPEMFPFKGINIFKFNPMDVTHISLYNKIFGQVTTRIYNSKSPIIFGAPSMQKLICNVSNKSYNQYEFLINFVFPYIPDNYVYRPHPAEFLHKKYIDGKVDDNLNFWELDCYENVTDETVLVSFYSTAAISPKLLYDKEPILVFLFPLCSYYDNKKNDYEYFLETVKSQYKDKWKIMIAHDMSELQLILNSINSCIGN